MYFSLFNGGGGVGWVLCLSLLCYNSNFAITLKGKRKLAGLLLLSHRLYDGSDLKTYLLMRW